ncbi:myelin and lymphocyte protein-like [Discoglossus pictus]
MKPSNDPEYAEAYVFPLPTGSRTVTSFPDALMICEIVFGGLIWILIFASEVIVSTASVQGWILFVSLSCFICTVILLIMYCTGNHRELSSWITADVCCQCVPAMLYFSAAVLQSFFLIKYSMNAKIYRINIAVVVFAYLTTLSYVIHSVFSLLRWKKSA